MIGVLLMMAGTFVDELSLSLEKKVLSAQIRRMVSFGFLQMGTALVCFALFTLFVSRSFVFNPASLPTVIAELILEIAQASVCLLAIAKADRSTFGFIRTLTIPLLLAVDIVLGYDISQYQIAGVLIIFTVLILLTASRGIGRKGIWYTLFTAVNAAATISLYKYNITNYNSVEAQNLIVYSVLFIFFLAAVLYYKQHPLRDLVKPRVAGSLAFHGMGALLCGFAMKFGPASYLIAIKRTASVLWAIVSGKTWFHEQHFAIKAASLVCCVVGILLLVLG